MRMCAGSREGLRGGARRRRVGRTKRRRIEAAMRRMAIARKMARRSFIVARERGNIKDGGDVKGNLDSSGKTVVRIGKKGGIRLGTGFCASCFEVRDVNEMKACNKLNCVGNVCRGMTWSSSSPRSVEETICHVITCAFPAREHQ